MLTQKGFNIVDAAANNENKQEGVTDSEANFVFPDGGWECNKCQNYNFKGRKACFRCKKAKSTDDCEGKPEHMVKPLKKTCRKVRKDDAVTNENCSADSNRVVK